MNALDELERNLNKLQRDLARDEAALLRQQLEIVRQVLADGAGTAEEKLDYLRRRLGILPT